MVLVLDFPLELPECMWGECSLKFILFPYLEMEVVSHQIFEMPSDM